MINCSHESSIFLTGYNLGLLLCTPEVYSLPLTGREVSYFRSKTFITQFLTIIIHDRLFIWIIDFSHRSQFGIVNYIFWKYIPFFSPRNALEYTVTFPRYATLQLWKNSVKKKRICGKTVMQKHVVLDEWKWVWVWPIKFSSFTFRIWKQRRFASLPFYLYFQSTNLSFCQTINPN